MTEEGIIG